MNRRNDTTGAGWKGDAVGNVAALVAVGVVLNMAVGEVVARLPIPLYLDSVGTVLAALLAGPWVGAATGVTANVVWGILGRPNVIAFAPTAAAVGLLAGWLARRGAFRTMVRAVLAGALTGLVAAAISAPIAAWLFGGVTGGGTDLLVALFRQTGASMLEAAIGQGVVSDPIDKALTFWVVFSIYRALPASYLRRWGRGPQGSGPEPDGADGPSTAP